MVGGVHDLGCGARGGVSAWWVGAEQPLTSSGTFTLGRHGRALDLATSIDQRGGGEGLAADARVRPLPGLQISGGGSSLARTGTVYVRWEDVDVLATGRWKDRAAHAALEYRGARGFGAAIERRWTEPEPESRPAGAADAVAPWLRWRATSLRLTAPGPPREPARRRPRAVVAVTAGLVPELAGHLARAGAQRSDGGRDHAHLGAGARRPARHPLHGRRGALPARGGAVGAGALGARARTRRGLRRRRLGHGGRPGRPPARERRDHPAALARARSLGSRGRCPRPLNPQTGRAGCR